MIWLTNNSMQHHQWAERHQDNTLTCLQCGVTRPILADWLSYPHHCPLRLEVTA